MYLRIRNHFVVIFFSKQRSCLMLLVDFVIPWTWKKKKRRNKY